MNFSETLIWVLVAAILLVAADALRRIVSDRRSRLHMKIDPRFMELSDEEDNNILGPVRKVGGGTPSPEPMIEPSSELADDEIEDAVDVVDFGNDGPLPADPLQDEASLATEQPVATPQATDVMPETPVAEPQPNVRHQSARRQKTAAKEAAREAQAAAERTPPPAAEVTPKTAPKTAAKAPQDTPKSKPQPILDVIVIHLLFPLGVDGEPLLQALLEQGLRYGEMKIFHSHNKDSLQFSLANAHEPGYFNIDQMEKNNFRAVSFFIKLPGPTEPLVAFNRMVTVAQSLADAFDGELRDENRMLLSQQMIEHLREKVQELERQSWMIDGNN